MRLIRVCREVEVQRFHDRLVAQLSSGDALAKRKNASVVDVDDEEEVELGGTDVGGAVEDAVVTALIRW